MEVFWPLKIEQGLGQLFEIAEGQRLEAGLLGRAEAAAATLELAQGEGGGFGLAAFSLAFLQAFSLALQQTQLTPLVKAQPENLAVGDAAGEVVDGDPTHGADLGNGAAAEA
jgi:hypothetical protein